MHLPYGHVQFCCLWICFLTQNCTRNHVITYTKKVLSFWCFHGRNMRLYIHLARSNVVSLVHLKVRGLQDFLVWTTVTLLSFDSAVHWIDIRESLFNFYSSFHSFFFSFIHPFLSIIRLFARRFIRSFVQFVPLFLHPSSYIDIYLLDFLRSPNKIQNC